MKRVIILFISMIIVGFSSCHKTNSIAINNNNKVDLLCKVWGLLKYHHPVAGSGQINWDDEFMRLLDIIDTCSSKLSLNNVFQATFEMLEESDTISQITQSAEVAVCKTNANEWVGDTSLLSFKNSLYLKSLIASSGPFTRYYVTLNPNVATPEFGNELPYTDSVFPSKNLRLLALARYWNVIYYFYPHIELNDTPWEEVLKTYIPVFTASKDTLTYHLNVLELTSQLNDGHVWTESKEIVLHFGIYSAPYRLKRINNKIIFIDFFTDSISSKYNIELGDELLKINGTLVDSIIKSRYPYYSFSNESHFMRRILEDILATPSTDTMILTINKEGHVKDIPIAPHLLYDLWQIQDIEFESKTACSTIHDSIGYINLRYLRRKNVDSIMTINMSKKKLIFDIRNYPKGVVYKISNYLNYDSLEFAKFFAPNISQPGSFYYSITTKTGRSSTDSIFQGRIILLVDENTQSHAEFTAMCLQASKNVTTIGSTTAGTDGNMTFVYLPGDIITFFTGLGVEYPDGTPTQRVGIKIDTTIKPTVRDIQIGHDPLLQYAIEIK